MAGMCKLEGRVMGGSSVTARGFMERRPDAVSESTVTKCPGSTALRQDVQQLAMLM